jgi:hypothetical protein
LDDATRGYVESQVDRYLAGRDWFGDISWIRNDIPLESFGELLLGYLLGSLDVMTRVIIGIKSQGFSISNEDSMEIKRMLKRRVPEIRERIAREIGR